MGRGLSWLANAALFVFCCSLVADTANAVFAALLDPGPVAAVAGQHSPSRAQSWQDRQVILSRNLFNASTLAPPVEIPPEDLEATRLPLKLHATAASNDSTQSLAIVEDLESGESTVVRVGGDLCKGKATVLLIERKRVVLTENGTTRELTFDEARSAESSRKARPSRSRASRSSPKSSKSSRLARRSRRPTPAPAPAREDIQPLAKDRFAVTPEAVENLVRNPGALLEQASLVPEFQDGQMIGVQIRKPKPGSVFEQLGLQDGDVIVELNGIPIDSPEQTARILAEISADEPATIGLAGGRTVNLIPQE